MSGVALKRNGTYCYKIKAFNGVEKQNIIEEGHAENSPAPNAFWDFESGAGTTILDHSESANTHNGTLVAPAAWYQPPAAGVWAINCSGTGRGGFTNQSDFEWDYNDRWTISGYTGTVSSTYAGFYVKRLGSSPASTSYRGPAIFFNNGNVDIYFVSQWGASAIHVVGSGTATNIKAAGVWWHIVVTYDGSSNASGITVWIDGVIHTVGNGKLTALVDTLGTNTTINSVDPIVCNDTVAYGFPIGGADQMNIWKGVTVTPEQAEALYNSGTPIECPRGL